MKVVTSMLLSLFSFTAMAASEGFVAMEPGMTKADHVIATSSDLKGELACDLYKFRVENGNLRESTLLVSKSIGVTQIGSYLSGLIRFPAPFENIAVGFNHAMVSYAETDDGYLPYIQGFFMINGEPDISRFGSAKDARFSLASVKPDSKLVLRGFYEANPTSLLTFRCSLRFLD